MSSDADHKGGDTSMNELEKENHELKIQVTKLQAQQRAQQDLLALVSHEIKTPVGGIVSMIEFLQHTPLNATQSHYMNTLSFAAENLVTATEDMLDYARLQSGHLTFKPKNINLQELLSSIALSIAPRAQAKGLDFIAQMDRDVPETIWVDPNRLNQVINNLANNALKFTSQGSISLKAHAQILATGEQEVSIEIADTGIGIEKSEQEKVFKPFVQASNAKESADMGSGLGLWISKQIAKGLNGTLSCISEKDLGSCFILKFKPATKAQPVVSNSIKTSSLKLTPVKSQPAKSKLGLTIEPIEKAKPRSLSLTIAKDPTSLSSQTSDEPVEGIVPPPLPPLLSQSDTGMEKASPSVPSKSEGLPPGTSFGVLSGHVLIVEDNKLNQMLIKVYLEKFGITFDIVENGLAAIAAVAAGKYDLILMDMMMPEMDGLTASKELHKNWQPEQHVPIIALSASANESHSKDYEEAGIESYVAKPIRGHIFYQALAVYLPETTQLATDASEQLLA